MPVVLRVALPVPLLTLFDYLPPAVGEARPGCRVLVPFGRGKQVGVVVTVEAETAVGTKLPKQYDHALRLLTDLRDLAHRTGAGAEAEFARRIGELRKLHHKKPSFIERLNRASMPQ